MPGRQQVLSEAGRVSFIYMHDLINGKINVHFPFHSFLDWCIHPCSRFNSFPSFLPTLLLTSTKYSLASSIIRPLPLYRPQSHRPEH